jgi:hypothetical protein
MTIIQDPPARRTAERPHRPRRTAQPGQPGQPAQPGQPSQLGQPGRTRPPGAAPGQVGDSARQPAPRAVPRPGQRIPFFIMLCALLGGALVCALVITTTLAAGSFEITKLQNNDTALARQRQLLQEQVAAAQSAQVIQSRALRLGMRPVGEMRFLNLRTGKVQTDAGSGPAEEISVPGYTP